MIYPTSRTHLTTPTPGAQAGPVSQLFHRWESQCHRLTLAAQHGEPIKPAGLLDELRLSEAIARTLTGERWHRVAALLLTSGAGFWADIADALDMPSDEAAGQFRAWIASQQRSYQAAGRGLSSALTDRLHQLLGEVTR